ncbi:MAG: threonine aldolase family protein [Lachnospiraceae bacterium]
MKDKVSFESDYIAGAHPKIMEALCKTNFESLSGYGADLYSESAREKIKSACECETAEVEFLVGGTQTNAIVISTMLKEYEGVIAAKTGHVSVHEAGAIEYTGKKVLELESHDGKICGKELVSYLSNFFADENREHMVFPGMVYISHPTEYGTLYCKKELEDLSDICSRYNIPLFLDGARLGYGLMSKSTDVTLRDVAKYCDVFYIGGTKVGALCGEAVVFTRNNKPKHFMNSVKKRGALLAKSRLLGIQFDTLFTNDLYFELAKHGIEMAIKLKQIFLEKGYEFHIESPSNQQFLVLENKMLEILKNKVAFSFWEKKDETHSVVRFATSWSTTKEDLEYLEKIL